MVPCQPRQLVIFSLPFAALVAFFWFKRRRSLSRSDPGGTLDPSKAVDNSPKSSVTEDTGALKLNGHCVKDSGVDCDQSPSVEECTVTNIKTVSVSPNKADKVVQSVNCSEVKSCSSSLRDIKGVDKEKTETKELNKIIPEADKEKIVNEDADSYFKNTSVAEIEVENKPTTAIESNELFNSTLIEEEDSNKLEANALISEDKPVEVLLNSELDEILSTNQIQRDICVKQNKSDDANVIEESICLEKVDLDTTLTNIKLEEEKSEILLEEQSTLENTALNRFQTEEHLQELQIDDKSPEILPTQADNIDKSDLLENRDSLSNLVDKVEDLSSDTGLGSQDLSTTEDSQTEMAQGQSTEKTESNAAGLEQKLASLGLDTQQAAQRAERDSANHSPAEVMLNSPAISTFSDAHSEGSSDSGKGCSDVVTPPSRTPAGGSSVAGDQVPSVYEFVLPQVIVGRLIGRHGVFLQDIRAKTHTNVFIKRHPETNSLKICAIEGTQPDIDAALKMIRQKFPLRRFPDLTLERVSFVKSSSLPINPENLQLHLVEGLNNDVVVSYMVTAGHLFLQLPMHMSYHSLYRMACIMNTVYNTQGSPPLPDPQPDVVCVAPAAGGWYRAQILSVDDEAHTSDVRFLDYGGFLTIDNSLLRQIRGDFMLLPFQAVECFLANVVPAGGEAEWSEAANQFVQSVTSQQILQAQVYDYTDTGLPLVYLYFTQFYQSPTDPSGLESRVVLLNQELVTNGFADLIEDPTQEDVQTQTATVESS